MHWYWIYVKIGCNGRYFGGWRLYILLQLRVTGLWFSGDIVELFSRLGGEMQMFLV